ncbi:MAG: ABC transporter permease [Burkholderiales bacterium RIFCSPLOWO2_02_FULL_57_36]|nr:MAG: ABC transporter permease [Burkholderiales bacterium RIFCSPLOWO2_02_FULL_57_36]
MNTILLALRNLLRNRRRSLTTLLAMIIGASAILLFGGYSRNITYGMQTGIVQRTGHLQIQHKDFYLYGNGNAAAYGIANYPDIIDKVKQDPVLAPMLTVATPTLQVSGIAGNFDAGVSRTVIGGGSVIVDQNRMRLWNDYHFPLKPQPLALTGTSEDSAVIGIGVARVLQLCESLNVANCPQAPEKQEVAGSRNAPDDIALLSALEKPDRSAKNGTRIEMLAASVHGAPNMAGLNIVKAETQGIKELDDMYIGLHLAQAQKLIYGSGDPKATAIALQLRHTRQIPAARARLEQLLSTQFKNQALGVQDFAKLNPLYGQSIAMFGTIFSFIALLIGSIVLFTVGNTMSMAVVERTVEIGTLRAMGLRRGGIRLLFMCEGFLLGVIGAALGVASAVLLSALINQSGLTWIPPGYVVAVPLNIYVWGETTLIVGSAIGLILVAILSAWWPANRASKMVIVDALRHV